MDRLTHQPSPDVVEGTDCPQWYADLLLGMLNRSRQISDEAMIPSIDMDVVYGERTVISIVEVYDALRQQ